LPSGKPPSMFARMICSCMKICPCQNLVFAASDFQACDSAHACIITTRTYEYEFHAQFSSREGEACKHTKLCQISSRPERWKRWYLHHCLVYTQNTQTEVALQSSKRKMTTLHHFVLQLFLESYAHFDILILTCICICKWLFFYVMRSGG
jgi:hypothetical protein